MTIVTLAKRRAREVARKTAAVAELRHVLQAYAGPAGGRFWLYGSAARGELRHDSDVDLLVDFADDRLRAAWDFAEAECARLGLHGDISPLHGSGERFLANVVPQAVSLP